MLVSTRAPLSWFSKPCKLTPISFKAARLISRKEVLIGVNLQQEDESFLVSLLGKPIIKKNWCNFEDADKLLMVVPLFDRMPKRHSADGSLWYAKKIGFRFLLVEFV